jgi:NAD(P)-dependent dehydrogenase (short-subunit alcohol dehydrogenase family)
LDADSGAEFTQIGSAVAAAGRHPDQSPLALMECARVSRFEGKNAVITGGSTGLGLATARALVAEGARVLITGRDGTALAAAADSLGGGAIAVRSDVTSLADIEALVDRATTDLGTVDALFANAGATAFAPFETTDEQVYDRLLAVNAKGVYFTVQRFVPLLAEGAGVVLTTSVVNVLGYPMVSAYAAGKAAVRSMARSMARELLPRKIRVNAVSPGPTDTGVLAKTMSAEAAEQAMARMAAENPMLRLGTPDEFVRAALFLAFDATFTTGAELAVDGGGSQI